MEQIRRPRACCCCGSSCWVSCAGGLADRRSIPRTRPRHQEEVGVPDQVHGHRRRLHRIAWTAFVYAIGGQSDSSESSQTFSAQLIATPAGSSSRPLGLVSVRSASRSSCEASPEPSRSTSIFPPGPRKGIVAFGVVGYVAKGIAIAVTGVLFVVAALTHDPETAGGSMPPYTPSRRCPSGRHPVGRRPRTGDLRAVLLRPRSLREDVNRGASTVTVPTSARERCSRQSPRASRRMLSDAGRIARHRSWRRCRPEHRRCARQHRSDRHRRSRSRRHQRCARPRHRHPQRRPSSGRVPPDTPRTASGTRVDEREEREHDHHEPAEEEDERDPRASPSPSSHPHVSWPPPSSCTG